MNLTDIAKKILSEDTWGNNPSAAAPQAPGRSPTATQPPASPNAKMIDISDTFKNFKLSLEKQEDAAVKKLVSVVVVNVKVADVFTVYLLIPWPKVITVASMSSPRVSMASAPSFT